MAEMTRRKIEKKFKVVSLEPYYERLKALGVQPFKDTVSIHHYAVGEGTTIRKVVEEADEVRITELQDHGGTFEFTKREVVESLDAGLLWLKEQGATEIKKLKMHSTEYNYKDGKIELIEINDGELYSVILYYEPPYHEEIAQELDLENTERIKVPFSEAIQKMS